MRDSAVISHSCVSIEQLEEVTRGLGWPTEYRQLKPGSFSSKVANLEGDSWFLMVEQSNRAIEVEAGAPTGMYLLALVEGEAGVINGQALQSNQIFILGPESDFRTTLTRGMKVTQVGVLAERFEDIAHAVAPRLAVSRDRATLIATTPGGLVKVRRLINDTLAPFPSRSATHDVATSRILADLIAVAADHSSSPVGRSLHSAAGRCALDRAREYIDARLSETIRVAAICRYADTTLRSLERIFAREFGLSPQQYVKVRRLNAVHHSLQLADGHQLIRVADIAQRHGFTHLGRFAVEYRRYFGESPRETLQRA